MENQDDKSLMEIFQKERFLAFFDICKIDEGGNGELDGLCKVAVSQEYPKADYMSLVFIFDTPSEGKSALAKRLLAKLSTEVFKRNLSGICAVTVDRGCHAGHPQFAGSAPSLSAVRGYR